MHNATVNLLVGSLLIVTSSCGNSARQFRSEDAARDAFALVNFRGEQCTLVRSAGDAARPLSTTNCDAANVDWAPDGSGTIHFVDRSGRYWVEN